MSAIQERVLSEGAENFIHIAELESLLAGPRPDGRRVRDILDKSLSKAPLTLAETACLLLADTPEQIEEIFETARQLKRDVYGNRIVLFAPLYIGNFCVNNCSYCGFRTSNTAAIRCTLDQETIVAQVEALERHGHKRLILVFGEHPDYTPQFIAESVRTVYGVRVDHGEIRRVNINAPPFDHEGFRIIKESGIGTYQVFQETYHEPTFGTVHPAGTPKSDFMWRLDSLSRAFEAGCDDVGIGALFGLYDWRFETLGLVAHSLYLQKRFHVGPHTISFPRLQPAHGVRMEEKWKVPDRDFMRVIAILRLAVPYTGLILTARESAEFRHAAMEFGVSQIDAGTRIELGGYTSASAEQRLEREQFNIGDVRSLDEVIRELFEGGYIPSFCTACYRLGRTGEHFMEYAIPGFIQRYCTPNALTTLMEYLVDYATPEAREAGMALVEKELAAMPDDDRTRRLRRRLDQIRTSDQRDLYE